MLLALCAVALAAYGNDTPRTSLADRTRAVASQLRCLVCRGESVADSPSQFSLIVRRRIRDALSAGETPDRIKSDLVRSYGNRILLAPPVSGVGSVAWLGPPLLVAAGTALLCFLVFDWRTSARPRTVGRSEYIERIRAELAQGGDASDGHEDFSG